MPTKKPDSVTLRSFQVGFGDCYLLTFNYPRERDVRHVLIDFGSTAMPKRPKRTGLEVAEKIGEACDGKLHAIVATHRHQDHISGFAGKSGKVIASLDPDVVIQPWTEDPDAERDATRPEAVIRSGTKAGFVNSLNEMHAVSEASLKELARLREEDGIAVGVKKTVKKQLGFMGENNIKNKAAVESLMGMGRKHVYAHYGSRSGLERLLPGVKVHVLGPPTLAQSKTIEAQRSEDAEEFWHLQAAAGKRAAGRARPLFPNAKSVRSDSLPFETRWFLPRLQGIRGEQMLQIVRVLDKAMNNTSLILLFEVGGKKLLFPGDAQYENWMWALKGAPDSAKVRKLLRGVDVYKVGHHGSLNATPKSLWNLFQRKGAEGKRNRLMTFNSTMAGKHGSKDRGSEVPRGKLVRALKDESDYHTTQDLTRKDQDCVETNIKV